METIQNLKNQMAAPDYFYRSTPFWAWNDKLENEELARQIREMKKQGIGGFFIHSREGLETPYLLDQWMDAVKHTISEAKDQKMEVWIYDEDKWPSGSAGGLVSHKNQLAYTSKSITLEVLSSSDPMNEDETIIFKCAIKEKNNLILEYCEYQEHLPSEWKILVFRKEISKSSEWYNGYAPPDNLNPDAVKTFIELTHEKYKKICGDEFCTTVKGFFTDEPNFCDFFSIFSEGIPWIPWTDRFADYFLKKRGYSIESNLPLLFFSGENVGKIRHDYWRTLTELFCESYVKQIYDWCDNHNLIMTGHVLYENDMGYSTRVCGAAMPCYRYMHAPGIDILGEQTKEYLTVKQCTSVANQYNRKTVFSETYGCTGWDFTFEGQKWLGDWQFVMGVNRRCQHLALYSIAGCRKRDYPPVFNYNTTWWNDNHILEEYFGRLAVCTSTGKVIRDILVIHPISSIWTMCGSSPSENFQNIEMNMGWLDDHILDLNKIGEEYNLLAKSMLGSHLDFDFGDEIIMAEEANIVNQLIQVKECSYSTIVIPKIITLFDTTVNLLKDFLENGGTIYWVKPYISKVNGTDNQDISSLLKYPNLKLVDDYSMLIQTLKNDLTPIIEVKNEINQEDTSILTMVRKLDDGYTIFAVNNDRKYSHTVQFYFNNIGKVTSYDLLTGETTELSSEQKDNKIIFLDTFLPAASRIYFISLQETVTSKKITFPYIHPHRADKVWMCLGPKAKITKNMENVLTLDQCQYRIEQGNWSQNMEVWQAQKEIRTFMDLQQIYYNGAPQRYSWIQNDCSTDGKQVTLKFSFYVKEFNNYHTYVVIEKPINFIVSCNGNRLKSTTDYFLDKSMVKFPLPPLKIGENEILIECSYKNHMELEDIYIIGNFNIDTNREMEPETNHLHFGDWSLQGLFHYPGNITYHFDIEENVPTNKKLILKLGTFHGTLVKVKVNQSPELIFLENSYREADITSYLKINNNQILVEVVGSPRNMFGPFHQTYTGCSRISWEDFRTTGKFYTPNYIVKPYGLMEQITIYEKE